MTKVVIEGSPETPEKDAARARLSLTPDRDDAARVVLTLDKLNLALLSTEPLRLARTLGGVLVLDERTHDSTDEPTEPPQPALLRVLADFVKRGEHVSTEQTAHTNAWKLCRPEAGFPKRAFPAAGPLFATLRQMERDGIIERGIYRDIHRKPRPEWLLTAKGWEMIGESAPSAPSAPSYDESAQNAVSLEGAPSAPSYGVGGMGDFRAHDEGANLPADSPMAEKSVCPRCDGEGCGFCHGGEA